MQTLPTEIAVSDFILSHKKPTHDMMVAMCDIFTKDFDNMRFWLRGEKIESEVVVIDAVERAYACDKMHMFEILQANRLVGEIGFASIDDKNKFVNIDYWLSPDMRGQRHIDNFLPIMEMLAFNNLDMNKVVLGIDSENIASRKIAERNDYKLDGILRAEKLWADGTVHDECEYSKLKSEWLKGKRNA